jgi:hypothetical protein
MPLGIKRTILDFEILETGNPMTLVFVDSSQYIEPPDRPLLEVFLPGFDKYLLANVAANQVNTFNSNTLGLGESLFINHLVVLPDGVWTFRFKICPYNYIYTDKKFMRTTLLYQKIDQAYNQLDLLGCMDKTTAFILDEITKAEILIKGAKAVVNKDEKKAFSYYQLANRIIDEIINKHCKNCQPWGVPLAEGVQ